VKICKFEDVPFQNGEEGWDDAVNAIQRYVPPAMEAD
jgi:hypothetical protein